MVGAVNDSQSKTTNGLLYIMVTSTTSELARPFYPQLSRRRPPLNEMKVGDECC